MELPWNSVWNKIDPAAKSVSPLKLAIPVAFEEKEMELDILTSKDQKLHTIPPFSNDNPKNEVQDLKQNDIKYDNINDDIDNNEDYDKNNDNDDVDDDNDNDGSDNDDNDKNDNAAYNNNINENDSQNNSAQLLLFNFSPKEVVKDV
eukprot:6327300-Ditylum_brightwellii.AAC.1